MYKKLEDLVFEAKSIKLVGRSEDESIKFIMDYSQDESVIDVLKSIVVVKENEELSYYSSSL